MLLSRLLLTLSENERFVAMLVDMLAVGSAGGVSGVCVCHGFAIVDEVDYSFSRRVSFFP